MSTLKDRLLELMTTMGWEYPDLVAASGMSRSVVSQWLGRGSKTIHSIGRMEAAERLEAASGFAALWLATGQGPKKAKAVPSESDRLRVDHLARIVSANPQAAYGPMEPEHVAAALAEPASRQAPPWPFRKITPQQWGALDDYIRGAAEFAVQQIIDRYATPADRRPEKRTGTQ